MFRRIFVTALVAGVVAGLFAAGAQRLKLIPLIQQAEIYEAAGEAHASHDHAGMAMAPPEWQPEEGFERTAYTVLADVLAGIGFALILTGAVACAGLAGYTVDARRGLLWGAAGFAIFTFAPSLGLPPLPPGSEAAELAARQIWWIGTALATAIGLGLIAFWPARLARVLGVVVLVLPHIIGAPHPQNPGGSVPGDIVAQFAVASITTAALFWLVLGGATGWLYRRLA
jgi:cobalt transporter subunit CbtA